MNHVQISKKKSKILTTSTFVYLLLLFMSAAQAKQLEFKPANPHKFHRQSKAKRSASNQKTKTQRSPTRSRIQLNPK